MAGHRLTWLDVFCDGPLRGNPLAVVHDADDLDPGIMLTVARELGLSETTFVQSPTAYGADYRNRIFDLRRELPFAGHPSLGTAAAVARVRGQHHASYVQQTQAGLQPVEVELDGEGVLLVTVSLGAAAFPETAEDKDGLIAAADGALYRAKRAGKNRTERANPLPARSAPAK